MRAVGQTDCSAEPKLKSPLSAFQTDKGDYILKNVNYKIALG